VATDATNNPMSPWLERVWLERYLERGLSAEETQSFEAYMLDKPELLEAVEADTDLRDGLVGSAGAVEVAPADSNSAAPVSGTSPAPRRSSSAWIPMAATLIVGIGLGLLLQRLPEVQDKAGGVIPSPTRVVFDTMRGEALEPRIEPGSPGTDAMLIEVGMPPTATNITVRIGEGPELPLVLSPDGFVSFVTTMESSSVALTALLKFEVHGIANEKIVHLPKNDKD